MSTSVNSTLLKTENNASYKVVNGVTYFKLTSEFAGDYTKNCGLLGEEIDENFYFLRGYDISAITIDNHNLIITRVDTDYDPIVVNLPEELKEEFGQPSFSYDKEKGVLTVTYPDGTTQDVGGFMIETPNEDGVIEVNVASDGTLKGNGTKYKPLGIAETERTGTYGPASEFYDISTGDTANIMPDAKNLGMGKGYRIVTKEKYDTFGMLYPYSGVELIEQALEEKGSQWRVPSKEDWDELLNAVEKVCSDGNPNHSGTTTGWYGTYAGVVLKSGTKQSGSTGKEGELWEPYDSDVETDGQDLYGMSIYPVGHAPERNSILISDDEYKLNGGDCDAEGLGRLTTMWTSSKDAVGNVYAKTFAYNNGGVLQSTNGQEALFSLRLIKDYAYTNFQEYEDILGNTYPCVDIAISGETASGIVTSYNKIWTKININYTDTALGGKRSIEWSAVTDSDKGVKDVYFICEWDGTHWAKKLMDEGDSVVIINYSGAESYHEWRVINGELVDTLQSFADENKAIFNDLYDKVSALTENVSALSAETITIEDNLKELSAATEALSAQTAVIEENLGSLSADTAALSAQTIEIGNNLNALSGETIALSDTINEFSASTVGEVERLDNKDIVPGSYTLNGDSDSEMVLPTSGNDASIKISISDDFFNFGNIINK